MTNESPDTPEARRVNIRNTLRSSSIQSQRDYDKTVITLSSGALGISFVFIKDVLGGTSIHSAGLALTAWILWAASLAVMLSSYLTGALLLNTAVRKLKDPEVTVESVARLPNLIQISANVVGGLLFVAGIVFLALFAYSNLGGIGGHPKVLT